jgi:hypothetical protein
MIYNYLNIPYLSFTLYNCLVILVILFDNKK